MARWIVLGSLVVAVSGCVAEFGVQPREEEADEPGPGDDALPLDPGGDKPPVVDDTAAPPVEEETEPVDPPEEEEPPADDPPPADDCAATSDLVYLVSRGDSSMYLFDPTTLDLTRLGELDCDLFGAPQSMAVSRTGHAYVRWSDDLVYDVDLRTGTCSGTSYAPGAFGAFGMGYATDSAATWRDQLYVANADKLAKVDTATWRRTVLATMPSQSELTGTALGELWAFLPLERPAQLAEIDKSTGATLRSWSLTSFPRPADIDAFAFAAWGGEFFLFVREFGVGSSSDVYRVDSGGRMELVAERIGIDVVGAGTSTCAPTQ